MCHQFITATSTSNTMLHRRIVGVRCAVRSACLVLMLVVLLLGSAPLAERYVILLQTHRYAANSLVGGTVMLMGDSLAQRIEQRQSDTFTLDPGRLIVCACFSACAHMPVNTFWYGEVVERLLPDTLLSPSSSDSHGLLKAAGWTLTKAAIGVTPAWVLNPIFFVCVPIGETICASCGGATSRTTDELRDHIWMRLKHDLLPVIGNAYRLWVPANVLMLTVTRGRPQYRVVVIALVSLMWKTYVTMVEHGPTRQDEQKLHQAQACKKECIL